ncbi:MAG TPA: nucleotidyltransferase domain-containing protein [Thermodesulfobacteriota bacterium]|nr:nucleotidyltransferase domain-containing protein [Thermodesulfobacteriota bacterium]
MLNHDLTQEIIKNISIKKPYKAFVFGSYAVGNPAEESDLDLLVVLDKDGVPKSYQEKSQNYLEVSRLLRDLNKKISMDIIVMTKPQWEEFVKSQSGFAREVLTHGVELI